MFEGELSVAAVTQQSRVFVDYTNYRGERSERRIEPLPDGLFFGSNEFHREPQWLLRAVDVEKAALRTFALRDVHAWGPAPSTAVTPTQSFLVRTEGPKGARGGRGILEAWVVSARSPGEASALALEHAHAGACVTEVSAVNGVKRVSCS